MKLQIVNRPPLAIPLGRGRQLLFCKYTENTDANIQMQIPTIAIENIHCCSPCVYAIWVPSWLVTIGFSFSNTKEEECGRRLLIVAGFNNSTGKKLADLSNSLKVCDHFGFLLNKIWITVHIGEFLRYLKVLNLYARGLSWMNILQTNQTTIKFQRT